MLWAFIWWIVYFVSLVVFPDSFLWSFTGNRFLCLLISVNFLCLYEIRLKKKKVTCFTNPWCSLLMETSTAVSDSILCDTPACFYVLCFCSFKGTSHGLGPIVIQHDLIFFPLVYKTILRGNQNPLLIKIYCDLFSGPFNWFLFIEFQNALIYSYKLGLIMLTCQKF